MIIGFFAKQVAKRAARNKKLLNKVSKKAYLSKILLVYF